MTTIRLALGMAIVFATTFPAVSVAQEHGAEGTEAEEAFHKNHLSLFTGGTTESSDGETSTAFSLGLDYERKRMTNKAISVYQYIARKDRNFRDLNERIPKLRKVIGSLALGGYDRKKEEKIVVSDDLEIRPTVGRYEVLEELGQGAMSIVYKARDPKIDRLLAIKTIRFSDEFEEDRLQEIKDRFFREAQIAGKLSHPSIVAIYDVGEDHDMAYIAMELLDGNDLTHFCRLDNLLPAKRVINIISAVAGALGYAHSRQVVHRDIKPANIMLLENDQVKVADFGIARVMSSSKTQTGIIFGTPNYMSPEQAVGKKVDGRSDLFSMGAVFYELLTGRRPFAGDSMTAVLYAVSNTEYVPPNEIAPKTPPGCVEIIDRLLAKGISKRYQSATQVIKEIQLCLETLN